MSTKRLAGELTLKEDHTVSPTVTIPGSAS